MLSLVPRPTPTRPSPPQRPPQVAQSCAAHSRLPDRDESVGIAGAPGRADLGWLENPFPDLFGRRDTKGKTYGASIVLHPRAAAALDKWIRSRGQVSPGDWLFPSQRSKDRPMRRVTAWRALHDAFVAAGVNGKSGTHCMRKTFAANVHRALGGDLFRLAKAMRHTSPLTTLAYLSFRQEEIDRATGLRRGRFVLSL